VKLGDLTAPTPLNANELFAAREAIDSRHGGEIASDLTAARVAIRIVPAVLPIRASSGAVSAAHRALLIGVAAVAAVQAAIGDLLRMDARLQCDRISDGREKAQRAQSHRC
jgi:hypothetical protein